MRNILKQTKLLAMSILMITGLSACATMEGFGRDVEKVGDEIQEAADK